MKTKLLFKTAFVALIFAACSSEDTSTTDNALLKKASESQEGSLYALEQNNRENSKQYFRFETGTEQVKFRSEMGVELTFSPNNLTVNGNPYNGPVVVEFIEVFGIGGMVATGMPTMGVPQGEANEDSALAGLITGGEFYVNMTTEEGQDIDDGVPYVLSVPTELSGGQGEDTEEMIVWTGEEDEDGDVAWEKDVDDDGNEREVSVEDGKFIMEMLSFGWCNIDKLDSLEGFEEFTGIWVDAPNGFNDTNSMVYMSYQGQMNMLTGFNNFDYGIQLFDDPYDNIPIGAQFNVIFVSSQGGQWLVGVKQVTIVGNDIIVFTQSDLAVATDPALINMLNSLP
ncbi:hypothetical protein DVK85_04335 [Flavobacterium arcticum]|uniref:Lipoprotein n=1 Tax=Flavobacterium arcticum TaxID=1784713 RepID=A0A345HA90_9FLAO|nr:hypothetical protein [Flavobacterium arcticum]AXG73500.1 hypothetical protein DVK85_04335 [Flavobacterium arcticum]KAF2513289.1 hypothetical protein E0W72_02385 [Flavobacterium arcticum]